MTRSYQQVLEGKWPSGIDKTIGLLTLEPDQLSERWSIVFRKSSDELGPFREAGLRLSSGRPILLLRYERSPHLGTEVRADVADNSESARAEFLSALSLPDSVFSWIPPDEGQ